MPIASTSASVSRRREPRISYSQSLYQFPCVLDTIRNHLGVVLIRIFVEIDVQSVHRRE